MASNDIKPKPDCPNSYLVGIRRLFQLQFQASRVFGFADCACFRVWQRQNTDFYFHMQELKSLLLLSVISPLETGQFEHLQEMITQQCHFVTLVPFRTGKPEISSSGNSPWKTILFKCSSVQILSPAVPSQSPFVNQTSKTRVPAAVFQILSTVTHSQLSTTFPCWEHFTTRGEEWPREESGHCCWKPPVYSLLRRKG